MQFPAETPGIRRYPFTRRQGVPVKCFKGDVLLDMKLNIVVVDDQTSASTLIARIIKSVSATANVVQFQDPREALSWCASHRADIVVVDYEMPEVTGLSFAKELRSHDATRFVPLLLVTVVLEDDLRLAAYEAGIDDIFIKPVNPKELQARIRRHIASREHQLQIERKLANSTGTIERKAG